MMETLHTLITSLNADEKRFIHQYLPLFEPRPAQQQALLQCLETLSRPQPPPALPPPLQEEWLPLLLDLLCLRDEEGDELQQFINQSFDASTLHSLRLPQRAIRLSQQLISEMLQAGHPLLAAHQHKLIIRIAMLGQDLRIHTPDEIEALYTEQENILQQALLQLKDVEDILQ